MKATLNRWLDATKTASKKAWDQTKALIARLRKKPAKPVAPQIPEEQVIVLPVHKFAPRSFSVAATKTRPQAWGTMSMRRYGSFAGKTSATVSTAPRGRKMRIGPSMSIGL